MNVPDQEKSIGAFIRARRKANGLTQRQLGELAGVGTRVVSEMEREKPTLRMDVVNAVLKVFGKRLGVVLRDRSDYLMEEPEPLAAPASQTSTQPTNGECCG